MSAIQAGTGVRAVVRLGALALLCVAAGLTAAEKAPANQGLSDGLPVLRQYCFSCHASAALGGLNLDKLAAEPALGKNFYEWRKVIAALEDHRMPPPKMPQPSDAERSHAAAWLRGELDAYARANAGDPGRVPLRRLSSGEYGYTIQDLTGLDIDVERDFVADSVGGEGFTNYGAAQFMEDTTLERYLDTAKKVAGHAVIGAGPLGFFEDPGKSGFELSAVSRIQDIYWSYGFRATAGEGGKPYGLDRYGKAFYTAWRFEHRKALGQGKATLKKIAAEEGIEARFAEHIWSVLQQKGVGYPTSEVISMWRKLPAPKGKKDTKAARAQADEIQKYLIEWPRWLFAAGAMANGGAGDERALLLTDASVEAAPKQKLTFGERIRRGEPARAHLWVVSVNPELKGKPVVIWRNATVRSRSKDRKDGSGRPLREVLSPEQAAKFAFGEHPGGVPIGENDFVTVGETSISFEFPVEQGAGGFGLQVEAEFAPGQPADAILRCTISESEDLAQGRPAWVLLAETESPAFKTWKANVLQFAANLPQISHGEPTPSDKDAIPEPFNNTYNQPERDYFHYKVKYYRDDKFLVEKILNDATRKRLDEAWLDLRASVEYHDAFLRFVAEKYKIDLGGKTIAQLDAADIEAIPTEPRKYVEALREDYDLVRKSQLASHAGHIEDVVNFASRAWRRPLSDDEKDNIRAFYKNSREKFELSHDKAIRTSLTRVLVAPSFLYRLEQSPNAAGPAPLSHFEMANRLSYFLWSSPPDQELWRAAQAGELKDEKQLRRQVKRMLADPTARRMATEFFGQWLGFYRFDQHRGVDSARFPEFTEQVKQGMYDEAISFFEHVLRKDRPVKEALYADYTFVTKALALHYGIKKEIEKEEPVMVTGPEATNRGGLLRLGAVLTATSAPLRTSPVKRGDWVLRRILGTPTPPPPADAGSIPADEKAFGGQTVRERLELHRRNPTCAGCHNRIDPLGFSLEHYDAVGRWRETYSEGQEIEDSGTLANNREISGVEGLIDYIRSNEEQVRRNLASKLVGFALGRTVQASDMPLIDELTAAGGDAPFSDLAARIVASPQFRTRRGREESPSEEPALTNKPPAIKQPETEGE